MTIPAKAPLNMETTLVGITGNDILQTGGETIGTTLNHTMVSPSYEEGNGKESSKNTILLIMDTYQAMTSVGFASTMIIVVL